jgi:catechol 2,3-dioxygenase-like lactoylglutathione lyase family enzyme
MNLDLGTKLLADFEAGHLSRRQLVARLMGLGAAMAAMETSRAQESTSEKPGPLFKAKGLHHIALDVTDVSRSRDFYAKHLGLDVVRGDDDAMFMGVDREFFLTLFKADKPGLNHYCYGIENYDVASAVAKLREAGINPRETSGRVYFSDPDGIEVQVASARET